MELLNRLFQWLWSMIQTLLSPILGAFNPDLLSSEEQAAHVAEATPWSRRSSWSVR